MENRLPEPNILSCYFEEGLQPQMPAMRLDWRDETLPHAPQLWLLPGGLKVTGPAPDRFGIEIARQAVDSYRVQLVWNQTRLAWEALSRRHLLQTSLGSLLKALGTDLPYLLDQPVHGQQPGLSSDAA